MSRVYLLSLATLLACARAYADESEVAAFVGGMATLRHLNVQNELWMHTDTSLPKVWWDFMDIKIDGSTGRYRLLSDGALQIVPLYHNDSGVYTFTALNKFGRTTQKIHLVVNDDIKMMPAGIAGEENAVVTGELGSPLEVRCLVYGKPPPNVFWYIGVYEEAIFIDNDTNYETRGNVLTIKSLNQDTLGKYTCRALNGVGPDAYWKFITQTTKPSATVETITTELLSNDEPEVAACVGGMVTLRHLNVQNELWMHTDTSLPKVWWDFRDIMDGPPECRVPDTLEDCRYGGVVWFFDPSRHECMSQANHEAGPACRHSGTFSSQEACERTCGAFRGVDVCKQRLEAGPCQSYVTKVYFDQSTGQCHEFIYGGCLGGANRFSSMEECSQVCRFEIDVATAPLALPQSEPELVASEGGLAILRCQFDGNPRPKITWKFEELTIDGNVGRYRLMSDGALEIVSLYRNDTGVYICVADNGLGVATQEIHLAVSDPVRFPVGIAGENTVVTGELGSPLEVRCLAYGYPPPSVFWYRGYEGSAIIVPYNDMVYLARGNILLIRRLAIETLGQYTCQAYNGEGKAASWVVFVRAYQPEGHFIDNELLVPRNTLPPRLKTQPPTTAETTTTTTTSTTEALRPLFTVPVYTHVSTPFSTLNSGADLRLACEVDGFPEPDVHWTKDGATIQMNGRVTITGSTIVSRLTVARVTVADSGLYTCQASNQYSSHSETVQINVQQLVVPAECTNNDLFADCNLIVRRKFCTHLYYSKFCCKACVEAGQLDPQEATLHADQPYTKN